MEDKVQRLIVSCQCIDVQVRDDQRSLEIDVENTAPHLKVEGKDYPTQMLLEVKDLRTEHRTVVEMKNIKYDQGLSEASFTEKSLMRSRW